MHHHRLKITPPSVEKSGRLPLGITSLARLGNAFLTGTGLDYLRNFTHHTTA